MLVVDLMHEFELGVWNALFIHLLRILNAEDSTLVHILDQRYVFFRQIIVPELLLPFFKAFARYQVLAETLFEDFQIISRS